MTTHAIETGHGHAAGGAHGTVLAKPTEKPGGEGHGQALVGHGQHAGPFMAGAPGGSRQLGAAHGSRRLITIVVTRLRGAAGFGRWPERRALIASHVPGIMLSVLLGMGATFVTTVYGGPTILFALLLGMAFNFLAAEPRFAAGFAVSSRSVLRLGVALLGARITLEQILGLGWATLCGVAAAVVLTILFGLAVARAAGLRRDFGILTGGSVAICGASAAAAIAAVLPRHADHERDTAFTIIGVTTLSTVAMVLYPLVAAAFGLSHTQIGVFLGGTIHDVAQVVGAGYSVSAETGDVATIVKLLRVTLLVPAVLAISLLSRRSEAPGGGRRPPLVPGFLAAFLAIVALNSLGLVPAAVQAVLADASRWCIVTAIAALGVKTSLAALAGIGRRSIALMVAETLFIAAFVLVLVHVG